MISEMLKKEAWKRRRIEVTLRVLGRVDTMLTLIRERAGRQLDNLEKARAKLDDEKRALETTPEPVQNAA